MDSVQHAQRRLNGLTHAIKRNLIKTIAQAQMDKCCPSAVFTGSGRAFCAGDDISGQGKAIPGEPLMPPIPPAMTPILVLMKVFGILSQTLNLAIRNCDKIAVRHSMA